MSIDWNNILKKFREAFLGKPIGSLTSREAWNVVRYNVRSEEIDQVVLEEIKRIEQLILYKAQTSSVEDSLIITVPENKVDLYTEVKRHFDEKGFTCISTQFPEIPEEKFLIISWKDGGK